MGGGVVSVKNDIKVGNAFSDLTIPKATVATATLTVPSIHFFCVSSLSYDEAERESEFRVILLGDKTVIRFRRGGCEV